VVAVVVVVIALAVSYALLRDGGPSESGATTTAPPRDTSQVDDATAAYLAALDDLVVRADDLATRAGAANDTWDDEEDQVEGEARADLFARTESALEEVEQETKALAAEAAALSPPSAVAPGAHASIVAALDSMVTAAEGMVEGLGRPRGERTLRLESRDAFVVSVDALRAAVLAVR
jgi:hypothetical protein